jgi:hypothetical protein
MDDKNGKNPFLALTAATMLFAALGVMVYTQAPFKPARPPVPPLHEPTEQIRARLWQDPFQAVLDQEKPGEEKGEAESKGKNKDAADKKS